MKLTDDQQAVFDSIVAFAHAPSGPEIATLSGYAGVGKTTVVGQVVAKVAASGLRVLVAASTNKAATVLANKINSPTVALAGTVHSSLALKMTENADGTRTLSKSLRSRSTLHEYDFAVIDEASMIDRALFANVLGARQSCRVLFVGDPAQLPPVGDQGLKSACFDPAVVPCQFALTEVVRQAAENPVIQLSQLLRKWVQDKVQPDVAALAAGLPLAGDQRVSITSGGDATLHEWAQGAFENALDTRILAFKNETVRRHNQALHNALHPNSATHFCPGEPVMVYELTDAFSAANPFMKVPLKNSELLKVVSCEVAQHHCNAFASEVQAYKLTLQPDDGGPVFVYVPVDRVSFERLVSGLFQQANVVKSASRTQAQDLSSKAWALRNGYAKLDHAYAMTIHKSQGSTFETVLLDWSDIPAGWSPEKASENSSLVYVAVTRTSENLAVVTR
jgi:exodeoxyribonuclease-5